MSQPIGIFVDGIVSARDKEPYVRLTVNGQMAQLSIAEAEKIARDLIMMAARTEADAMVLKFFDKEDFPTGAAVAIMRDFRHYRLQQDSKPIESTVTDPDTGEEQ